MWSVAFWLLASLVTCGIVGAMGALTGPIALLIFIVWAVLTWGGILILDSDDFF